MDVIFWSQISKDFTNFSFLLLLAYLFLSDSFIYFYLSADVLGDP